MSTSSSTYPRVSIRRFSQFLVPFGFAFLIVFAQSSYAQSKKSASSNQIKNPSSITIGINSTPELEFIPNRGQLFDQNSEQMPEVLYYSDSKGMKCYYTARSMHFVFRESISPTAAPISDKNVILPISSYRSNDTLILERIDMEFVGANPSPTIEALDSTDGYMNFYLNRLNITNVRGTRRLVYHDLYPDIDLVLYSKGSVMEYDFIVHPGGNPDQIVMRYEGTDSLDIKSDGRFRGSSELGILEEESPSTFQEFDGRRQMIQSHFVLSDRELHVAIGQYNHSSDLIIDPQRQWGTYYGGSGTDAAYDIKSDFANNRFVTAGSTFSSANIATSGAFKTSLSGGSDAFVARFDQNGNRIWATYFGGENADGGIGIGIDSARNIILEGVTNSSTGIATSGAYQTTYQGNQDLFVAKFDSTGALLWATYFGGTSGEGAFRGISIGGGNSIFIAGSTQSTSNIATSGSYQPAYGGGSEDGFLAKFSASGSLQWSTYFGGPSSDEAYSVATDASDNPTIVGITTSSTNIATTGAYQTVNGGSSDGFVAKFDDFGNLIWATYYGGASTDQFLSLSLDASNNIYAVGQTSSSSGIATSGSYQSSYGGGSDGMIVKFNSSGALQWATYYGGTSADYCNGVQCWNSNLFVTGLTNSSSNIATSDGYQTSYGGGGDAFLSKFSNAGMLVWGTYYGGSGNDDGDAVTTDGLGDPLIAGETVSSSGIATVGSFQATYAGGADAFFAKFCDLIRPSLQASRDTLCKETADTLSLNASYSATQWFDGSTHLAWLDDSNRYILPDTLSPGLHRYSVIASSPSCSGTSDTLLLLLNAPPIVTLPANDTVCTGTAIHLSANASGKAPLSYQWSPSAGLDNSTVLQPVATVSTTTTYTLTVLDSSGCSASAQTTIHVNPTPTITAQTQFSMCQGSSVGIGDTATGGTKPYQYSWFPITGLSASNVANPVANPQSTTQYTESVIDKNGCTASVTITVQVDPTPAPLVSPNAATICTMDSTTLAASLGFTNYHWNTGANGSTIVVHQPGKYAVTVSDANGCTGTSDTVIVTGATPPNPIIAGPSSVCPNSKSAYSVIGDSGATYQWSVTGGGTISSGQGTKTVAIQWATSGTVSIAETSLAGCTKDTMLTVTASNSLSPTVSPVGPVMLCQGDSVTLTAQPGYTAYQWSTGATTQSVTVAKSGSYTVTVTGTGGCTGTSQPVVVNVLTNPKPLPVVTGAKTSFCEGDSVQLSTTQSYTMYQWSTGATTPSIEVSQAGSYSVIVTNSDGCTGVSLPMTITVNPKPTVSIVANGPLVFCSGASVILSATSGGASYLWSDGETSPTIVVRTTGDYSVALTNVAGCTAASQVMHVQVNPTPSVTISGPVAVCPGSLSTYTVSSQNGVVLTWSVAGGTLQSGQSTNSVSVSWTTSGAGTVSITASDTVSGCTSAASLSITINNTLVPVITDDGPITFCQGDSVVFDAGAGYSTYQWQLDGANISNATHETFAAYASGAYSVFVTNNGSCQGTSHPVTVMVDPLPAQPLITRAGQTLSSSLASMYQWSLDSIPIKGAIADSVLVTQGGYYTVTISDSNGCSNTSAPFHFADSAIAIVAVPAKLTASPGDQVALPIELLNSQNLALAGAMHYTAKIRFNNTLLAPQGTTPQGVLQGNDMVVTINGTNPLPLGTTTGTLATLNFLATLGNDTCTPVLIDEFVWTDGNVSVTRQNGEFCLTGICKAGGTYRLIDPNAKLSLSLSHPNPATSTTSVDYDLDEQGETDLFITDILGKEVKHILTGIQFPGHYTANFDLVGLAQGSYIYVLKTPSAKLSHLMQVLR